MLSMTEAQDKVTYEQAAVEVGRSTETIRKWASRGLIKRYSRGVLDRRVYVSLAEIRELLAGGEPQIKHDSEK